MFNEENTVEELFIATARGMGWKYIEAKDMPRQYDEVMVESWLQDALVRLNPITAEQAEQVIYKLRSAIMSGHYIDSLVEANNRFRSLLFEDNTYPFGKDGEHIPVRFFSDNDEENFCVVTNQWEFPRGSVDGGKRLDLVFLINGIPLVIGETKSPVRPQVTWADGAADIFLNLCTILCKETFTGSGFKDTSRCLYKRLVHTYISLLVQKSKQPPPSALPLNSPHFIQPPNATNAARSIRAEPKQEAECDAFDALDAKKILLNNNLWHFTYNLRQFTLSKT